MTRWQIFCAVGLRRFPSLLPKPSPLESRVQDIFYKWEAAKSRYSDHELQLIEDANQKESVDISQVLGETARDREDRWLKLRSQFSFGPHDDRLTKTFYLFVRQMFGSELIERWLLPQAEYDPSIDENLLDTGKRALNIHVNIKDGYHITSKIPSALYSFKYPKKIRETIGFDGAKVFFLKANLDKPSKSVLAAIDGAKIRHKDGGDKLKWLTRDEAFKVINETTNLNYMRSFGQGLFYEDKVDTVRIK